jgi:signal transduction histidine kinase
MRVSMKKTGILREISLENQLLPFLAHDLNNYLHVINAHITIARAQTDKASVAERLRTAEAGLQLIRLLIQQGFADEAAPEELMVIDMASLIHAVTAITSFMITGSEIYYELIHRCESGAIRFRCNTLLRVMANLLTNAKEAMPAGGKITVDVSQDKGSEMGDPQAGLDFVSISLQDTGTGIPEENLPLIFMPGFSTKKAGNGLGLAFCRDAIVKNGGRLEVASTLGVGTIFTIRLPVHHLAELQLHDTQLR